MMSTTYSKKIVNLEKKCKDYKTEEWYTNLSPECQQIADTIYKYHDYYSKKDKRYRNIIKIIKLTILLIALVDTIILGLNGIMPQCTQINIGLILSACTSFVTAISVYFNLEEYWMRNITIHIRFNIMRDEFTVRAKSNSIDDNMIEKYINELTEIQKNNIVYWEKASRKL